jgi:hypothetical protein
MLRRADFVLHDFRGSGNRKNCQFAANLLPNAAKKARILLPLLCIPREPEKRPEILYLWGSPSFSTVGLQGTRALKHLLLAALITLENLGGKASIVVILGHAQLELFYRVIRLRA